MSSTTAASPAVAYWTVIPAAGTGRRMGAELPKQYLRLHGRSVLEWASGPFLLDANCRGVVLALAADDANWAQLNLQHPKLQLATGGIQRADTVLAGLNVLLNELRADANDWVLVHDAARPCLHVDDLTALLQVASDEAVGALLATPLVDTLKQADADLRVAGTVPRAGLWRAQTPQMFRTGLLRDALLRAQARGVAVTDEASAVEALGLQPRLVPGRADNIKLTLPEDLVLAHGILAARIQ